MSRKGSIIILDDDGEDLELIGKIIAQLKLENPVQRFSAGDELLEYLRTTTDTPMLILCDINMPMINGLEVKAKINADSTLREKCIPFVFLTTAANKTQVSKAYQLNVQGFVVKGSSFEALRESICKVIDYWRVCVHPADF
jgi:CheY-like chemotaxis protein